MWPFSTRTTPRPRPARWNATLAPMQPAPTTTTSVRFGTAGATIAPDIESLLIAISIDLHSRIRIYVDSRFDKSLSRMTSDEPDVPDVWQIGLGEERARVAIVGCGGAGCNTLRHVTAPANAVRIAMNDAPHPSMAEAADRILIPATSLEGYASMDPKAVPQMETDEEKAIASALLDRDIALIIGGLGGDVQRRGLSTIARVAPDLRGTGADLLTVAFPTYRDTVH